MVTVSAKIKTIAIAEEGKGIKECEQKSSNEPKMIKMSNERENLVSGSLQKKGAKWKTREDDS